MGCPFFRHDKDVFRFENRAAGREFGMQMGIVKAPPMLFGSRTPLSYEKKVKKSRKRY